MKIYGKIQFLGPSKSFDKIIICDHDLKLTRSKITNFEKAAEAVFWSHKMVLQK